MRRFCVRRWGRRFCVASSVQFKTKAEQWRSWLSGVYYFISLQVRWCEESLGIRAATCITPMMGPCPGPGAIAIITRDTKIGSIHRGHPDILRLRRGGNILPLMRDIIRPQGSLPTGMDFTRIQEAALGQVITTSTMDGLSIPHNTTSGKYNNYLRYAICGRYYFING